MVLGPDSIDVGAWNVEKSKGKKKKDEEPPEVGCWIKFRFIGSCISSKTKVDSSSSGTSSQYAESKTTNDTSKDHPVVLVGSSSTTSKAESTPSTPNISTELKVASQLRKFSFNELKSSTRNFRPESLLGEGGFGCVFKGWINENGTAPVKPGTGLPVAVKTLNHDGLQGHKEWLAEVNYLGDLLHPNLVKLIGYCVEEDQRLLVYEFMPRGSLENHLFRRSLPLPWSIRMKILLGAAKGLAFLHEEAERPDYNPKLSDFGLAKDGPEGDKTHVSTRVMGTYGYAAPEYVMTGELDMLGERRRFYRIMDQRLDGRFSIKGAQKAIQLAAHCLHRDPKARPLMSEVVEALKPLPYLKDMACSSSYFQAMQVERSGSNLSSQSGSRLRPGLSKSMLPARSLSATNGSHVSPYHHNHYHRSPAPNAGQP
ncbi:hypothetical protein Tsubulata_009762 [Turnera subulata]|uniref:non-specific serine/threonine protein kinase n=1 Tax=Turnera subulata TaxID=218843 RepID=A0A9Q0F2Y1_9ROSI|nr:hypothetical protein Tsubulata_009762 [Turnera subulata]